jgi:hypothetical protein
MGSQLVALTNYHAVQVQYGMLRGKVHPRRGDEGPKREQRYSPTLSLTSALDGVGA